MWAPFCTGDIGGDGRFPWTGCQSREVNWAVNSYFTYSPAMSTEFNQTYAGRNFTKHDPISLTAVNPFDIWLLCCVNGSCTDLTPFAMIGGGIHGLGQFNWSFSRFGGFFDNSPLPTPRNFHYVIGYVLLGGGQSRGKPFAGFANVTFKPTPVCNLASFCLAG